MDKVVINKNWIIKNGLKVYLVIILLSLGIAYFVNYPVVIAGHMKKSLNYQRNKLFLEIKKGNISLAHGEKVFVKYKNKGTDKFTAGKVGSIVYDINSENLYITIEFEEDSTFKVNNFKGDDEFVILIKRNLLKNFGTLLK